MNDTSTHFAYTTNVKLNHIQGTTLASHVFPNIEDLVIASKHFDNLETSIKSAIQLNSEIIVSLNAGAKENRYALINEINPEHSKEKTLSTEWAENEFAKLWIIDKIEQERKGGKIQALGLTQIFGVDEPPPLLN